MYKGQIAFWDMGPSRRTTPAREHAYAGVGIVESHGDVVEHVVRGFTVGRRGGGLDLPIADHARDVGHETGADEIGALLRKPIWPLPGALSGLSGGGIVFRRTRVAPSAPLAGLTPGSEPRTSTHLVAMLVAGPPGLIHDRHRYDLSGRIGAWPGREALRSERTGELKLTDPQPWPEAHKHGITIGQLLKEPIWGFAEPYGFVSTLDLATMDEASELDRLLAVAPSRRTARQEARIEVLRTSDARWIVEAGRGDDTYRRFRKSLVRQLGPTRWDGTMTRREIEDRERVATRIVRRLARDERPRRDAA